MNKKIRIAITAAFLAVVMLAMTVAVSASSHRWYEELHIASGTQILKGSLQVNKTNDNLKFTSAYTTLRYDPSGTAGPGAGYQGLHLEIKVYGYWNDRQVYTDGAVGTNVAEGAYIATANQNVSSPKINEFKCYYYAKTPGSDRYFAEFSIIADVNTPSD